MEACSYAKEYKATRKPKCNDGKGCDECNEKWEKALRDKEALDLLYFITTQVSG